MCQTPPMPASRINRSQRIIIVIGLGALLFIVSSWMVTWGSHLPYGSATFTTQNHGFDVGGFHPWVKVAIWVVATALWAAVSIALMRTNPFRRRGDER